MCKNIKDLIKNSDIDYYDNYMLVSNAFAVILFDIINVNILRSYTDRKLKLMNLGYNYTKYLICREICTMVND